MRTLAFGLILALAVARAAPTAAPLRIATFNVKWLTASAGENRMAPWTSEEELAAHRRDIAHILAEDVRADIICILEVTSRDALDKLAAEPALRKSGYRALHLESGDTGTGQDVAFLARIPLDAFPGGGKTPVEIRRFADGLPAPEGKLSGKKPAARARLTKHAVVCLSSPAKLCVMGVHLLAHPDDRARNRRRAAQAAVAARIIRDEIVAKGYTPLIVGDFNDFDTSAVLRAFKDFDPARPGPELFSAAERIRSDSERYSAYWDKNKNGKLEEGEPVSLIDHILLDRSLAKRLVKAEILHKSHDGSISDHWPVVVEIGRL